MGGLQGAGLPIAQESLGSDKGRHRGIWNRPSGAAELVNPDADGHGWAGDEAKEPWRCGERHPPARPYDWDRIQQQPWIQYETLRSISRNRTWLH